jgi:uncharacterized protein YbcI
MQKGETEPEEHGPNEPGASLRADISGRIAALYREHYGQGPEKIKTYIQDDTVLCVLRGGATQFEKTLSTTGDEATVRAVRSAFQELLANPFTVAIQELTGRRVEAYFSGNSHDPDISVEVFVLEQNPA